MNIHKGFSLIELAIVLVIVTILIGGLAVPLSAQVEARRIAETRKTMEEAREAIIGYAMSHPIVKPCTCQYQSTTPFGFINSNCPTSVSVYCPANSSTSPIALSYTGHYLPCPDLSGSDPEPAVDNDGVDGKIDINNGVEDRLATTGACATTSGNLPWVTLGTASQDAWGNRLYYAVTPGYGDPAIGFSNTSVGDKQICSTSVGGCAIGTVARDVPVVVISYGPNGWGARNVNNTTMAMPTSADELENVDLNNAFVTRSPTKPGSSTGEFDDLVVWISSPLLFSRVCAAGGCP